MMFTASASVARPKPPTAAKAAIARMATRPDGAQRARIAALFRGFAQLASVPLVICLPASADPQAGMMDLISPNYALAPVGGVSHAPWNGFQGDGVTGRMTTGIVPSAMPGANKDEGFQLIVTLDEQASDATTAGATSAGNTQGIRVRGVSLSALVWMNTANAVAIRRTTSIGPIAVTRGAATGLPASDFLVYDGTAFQQATLPATALPTNGYSLMSVSNGATRATNVIAAFVYGTVGLSQADTKRLTSLIMRYLHGVGAFSNDNEAPSTELGQNYWSYTGLDRSMQGVTWPPIVMAQGRPAMYDTEPPVSPTGGFTQHPANVAVMGDLTAAKGSTATSWKVAYLPWSMRRLAKPFEIINTRPNPIAPAIRNLGRECRLTFEGTPAAVAATSVLIMWILGDSIEACQARGARDGVTVVPHAMLKADPGSYFTGKYDVGLDHFDIARNVIYLPPTREADLLAGMLQYVMPDQESQDGRTTEEAVAANIEWAAIARAHGKKYVMYGNPLGGTGALRSGFNADSLPQIAPLCDLVGIQINNTIADVAGSIDLQAALPQCEDSKIMLVVGLRGLTTAQATIARAKVVERGFTATQDWNNGARKGGGRYEGVNPVIAIMRGLP